MFPLESVIDNNNILETKRNKDRKIRTTGRSTDQITIKKELVKHKTLQGIKRVNSTEKL